MGLCRSQAYGPNQQRCFKKPGYEVHDYIRMAVLKIRICLIFGSNYGLSDDYAHDPHTKTPTITIMLCGGGGGSGCDLRGDRATAMAVSLAALTALTTLNIRRAFPPASPHYFCHSLCSDSRTQLQSTDPRSLENLQRGTTCRLRAPAAYTWRFLGSIYAIFTRT